MIVELLRKGHIGPIVSAVTVRNLSDLGYIEKHRECESRYANFDYVSLPTREPGIPKRYIQDLFVEDTFEKEYGVPLDPANTHVFMCGKPAMIGLPTEEDCQMVFPNPTGVREILTGRGFTLDSRKARGNLHYEELLVVSARPARSPLLPRAVVDVHDASDGEVDDGAAGGGVDEAEVTEAAFRVPAAVGPADAIRSGDDPIAAAQF